VAIAHSAPLVSVVIPVRNEEGNIGTCLDSLVRQEGVAFEIFVVDDQSTDRTREIAQSCANATVLQAGELPAGWRGKANAIWTAVPHLKGEWFLFSDADTMHLPGSLAASVQEALDYEVDLLSYSPFQEAATLGERCVQPVVFGELNRVFNYEDVNDKTKRVAAANGQFMLFRRRAYLRVGGHAAVKGSLLEDVELAKRIKEEGRLRFRYAPDRVRARMYQNFSELEAGWTKNLSLLFPNASFLAFRRSCEFATILAGVLGAAVSLIAGHTWIGFLLFVVALSAFANLAIRIRHAGFPITTAILSIAGLPIFIYLLSRSYRAFHVSHEISWRGRTYKNV
jgi:glycosyltransferase involved in cell wall biosynthesis